MHINKTNLNSVFFSGSFYSDSNATKAACEYFTNTGDIEKLNNMVDSFSKMSDDCEKDVEVSLDYAYPDDGIGFIMGAIRDKDADNTDGYVSCGSVFDLKNIGIDKAIRQFKEEVAKTLQKFSSKKP